MSRSSSVTRKKDVVKHLTKLGYCNCDTKSMSNDTFCISCGKPHMPSITKRRRKPKEPKNIKIPYKIRCPYCKKLYTLNSYKKHIKKQHTNAIKAHIKTF